MLTMLDHGLNVFCRQGQPEDVEIEEMMGLPASLAVQVGLETTVSLAGRGPQVRNPGRNPEINNVGRLVRHTWDALYVL